MRKNSILHLSFMAMLIALGVVISPILRIEGMCPMAHLINIVAAVFLGPTEAFVTAFLIGCIRMALLGIPPLALTGAVFGALLAGIFYRWKREIWAAVLGEIIGTGIIGAIVSYPVMTLFYGKTSLTWFFYVPFFIGGTLIGGTLAFLFLLILSKNGNLIRMQKRLGTYVPIDERKGAKNADVF